MIMAPICVAVDVLLRSMIVPRMLERCRESSYYQKTVGRVMATEKDRPGYASALFTEK